MTNLLMTPSKRIWKRHLSALIITGAIKGNSWEYLYKEIGLKSLCGRRWYYKLVFFDKIVKGLAPSYLRSKHLLSGHQLFAQLFFLIAKKNGTN